MSDQTGAPQSSGAQRPEDENLGFAANLMYGLQHVLTMYGGIVAVPLIVAEAAGMSAADAGLLVTACLFMAGLQRCCRPWACLSLVAVCLWCKASRSRALPPWSAFCIPVAVCKACWGLSCMPRYWA